MRCGLCKVFFSFVDLCLCCFVIATSSEAVFLSYPMQLLCEVAGNTITDWMYRESGRSRRQRISVNGTARSDRYTVDGSSLIIKELKASDAGIYSCGHGELLYQKMQLKISGM